MSDPKALFLKEWLANLEKVVTQMRDASITAVSKHSKGQAKSRAFAEALELSSQRELGQSMSSAMKTMSESIEELEGERDQIIPRLQANLVDRLQTYDSRVKKQKDNIAKRNAAFDKVTRKQKEVTKLATKSNRDERKIAEARDSLSEENLHLGHTETKLNNSIVEFEKDKANDLKDMLLRYCECHMYFYSRGLEQMTKAYEALSQIDVEADSKNIVSTLMGLADNKANAAASAEDS